MLQLESDPPVEWWYTFLDVVESQQSDVGARLQFVGLGQIFFEVEPERRRIVVALIELLVHKTNTRYRILAEND